jgi:hypothetical protein
MKSLKFISYYLFLIAASLVLSLSLVLSIGTKTINTTITFAYAQTNAGMLDDGTRTFFFASNIGSHNNDGNNQSSTSSISASNEELKIKKDLKYFDNSSGYLVYPSIAATTNASQSNTTVTKKIPAVITIHENRGLNDPLSS